jgi:hypothetical protein
VVSPDGNNGSEVNGLAHTDTGNRLAATTTDCIQRHMFGACPAG